MKTVKTPGLYIHIPFCRTKCPYCGFYSIASTKAVSRWLAALGREARLYRDQFPAFDTLYLGGGTPSILKTRDLERILHAVSSHFHVPGEGERTLEANPGDLTAEKIVRLKALGFNRISLGVQSFHDHELRFLGRRHRGADGIKALENLRGLGFKNLSVDLMYGFQGQTLKSWVQTLRQALAFEPEHLSCYQLTFEKGTLFWRQRERHRITPIPESLERAFFLITSRFLKRNGYVHYEISSFARGKAFRSRHNSKYWRHAPYLGLGPSAHSYQHDRRWWNVSSVRKYCDALEQGRLPIEGSERLSEDQIRLESLALGLRTNHGVALSECTGPHLDIKIARLKEAGLIRIAGHRMKPTLRGMLVADRLPVFLSA